MGRNGVLELIIIIVIVIIIEPYRTKISLLRHRTRHIVVQLNDTVGPKFTGVESQSIPSKKKYNEPRLRRRSETVHVFHYHCPGSSILKRLSCAFPFPQSTSSSSCVPPSPCGSLDLRGTHLLYSMLATRHISDATIEQAA